jgi:hypothetical protein
VFSKRFLVIHGERVQAELRRLLCCAEASGSAIQNRLVPASTAKADAVEAFCSFQYRFANPCAD